MSDIFVAVFAMKTVTVYWELKLLSKVDILARNETPSPWTRRSRKDARWPSIPINREIRRQHRANVHATAGGWREECSEDLGNIDGDHRTESITALEELLVTKQASARQLVEGSAYVEKAIVVKRDIDAKSFKNR